MVAVNLRLDERLGNRGDGRGTNRVALDRTLAIAAAASVCTGFGFCLFDARNRERSS